MKFFPAEATGGVKFLSSVRNALPNLQFCPTGGISASNASEYLNLTTVPCVGGSWLTPEAAVQAEDCSAIAQQAHNAAKLRA